MTRIKQHCPEDVGRIPLEFKINDHENLEGLTADQMKNWVICFSIPSLKDKIPGKVFDCWKKFVMACFHLCNRVVTIHDVQREPLSTNGKYLVRNLASKWTGNLFLITWLHKCLRFREFWIWWRLQTSKLQGYSNKIENAPDIEDFTELIPVVLAFKVNLNEWTSPLRWGKTFKKWNSIKTSKEWRSMWRI